MADDTNPQAAPAAEKAPKTIKVRILADYAGFVCNSVHELPAEEAKGLIDAGYADASKAAIVAALDAAKGDDAEAAKLIAPPAE